jgi:hypothetical protein
MAGRSPTKKRASINMPLVWNDWQIPQKQIQYKYAFGLDDWQIPNEGPI